MQGAMPAADSLPQAVGSRGVVALGKTLIVATGVATLIQKLPQPCRDTSEVSFGFPRWDPLGTGGKRGEKHPHQGGNAPRAASVQRQLAERSQREHDFG